MRTRLARGFTLPELLAILAIGVLLMATFVPYAIALRETANRAQCADYLRKIWWALDAYARESGGSYSYPRTRFDPRLGNSWTAFTGADEPSPFRPDSQVQPNDVSASLWLLLRTTGAQPEWFVCPSSGGTPDRLTDITGTRTRADLRGNFREPQNLTYAFATPYSAVEDYALNDRLPADFVLLADRGPSVETLRGDAMPNASAEPNRMAVANSANHRRAGQNVLYAAGNVSFQASPYVGVGISRTEPRRPGDNIYTALAPKPLFAGPVPPDAIGAAGTDVGPAYRYDTYLVPAEGFVAPAPIAPSRPATSRATSWPVTTRATATTTRAIPPTSRPSPATSRAAPAATRGASATNRSSATQP